MGNNATAVVPEDDPSEAYDFGSTRSGSFGEFARAHGKEPSANYEVGNNGWGTVAEEWDVGTRGGVQPTQEPWGDCFLAVGRGVDIVKGPE